MAVPTNHLRLFYVANLTANNRQKIYITKSFDDSGSTNLY